MTSIQFKMHLLFCGGCTGKRSLDRCKYAKMCEEAEQQHKEESGKRGGQDD